MTNAIGHESPKAKTVEVRWDLLHKALKAALVVCSRDELRLALNSVLVEAKDKMLTVVASDGHRLVHMTCELAGECDECGLSVQLSRESVKQWLTAKPIKYTQINAQLTTDGRECTIEVPGNIAKLRHVDARFPPYDCVIPKRNWTEGAIPKRTCASAVGATAQYLADAAAIAKTIGADLLVIELADGELDPIRLDADAAHGKPLPINMTYVLMPYLPH